jgi:hypothetical protein
MVIEWGSPEESAAAREARWNRMLAEGHTMLRNGVVYHPDGTTSLPWWKTDSGGQDSGSK